MEINVNLEEKTCSVVEEESELKDCIVKLADLGFPLTLKDIGKLVESFVNINNVETAKNILKHRGCRGHPGPDWTNSFIKRNNLSLETSDKAQCAKIQCEEKSISCMSLL